MKLRHSAEMRDVIAFIFPKVFQILLDKAAITGAICTSGELVAASRYLAKALAEYDYVDATGYVTLDIPRWMRCIGKRMKHSKMLQAMIHWYRK
jgi:hypothetical protein